MSVMSKLLESELINLDDRQIIILDHLISYICRYNLESGYIPSELLPIKGYGKSIIFFTPVMTVEEKYPDELKLLNKVLALYAMSDKGD